MLKKSKSLKSRSTAVQSSRTAIRPQRASDRSRDQINEELAVELYSLIRLALNQFGVKAPQQQRAIERARHLKTPPRVSGPLLRDKHALSELLLEWSREAPYLDSDGKPRVLAIAGPGATFESLSRRFLPNMPLDDVVSMACETAEVVTRPQGRIALLGSILVKLVKSREGSLAHLIRHIDLLLGTTRHNRRVRKKGLPNGRMERLVLGVISRGQFDEFMRELRPQIYDLLLGVDASIQQREPKTLRSRRSATAVSVGIYVAQEDDLARAGVGAAIGSSSARRRKSKVNRET